MREIHFSQNYLESAVMQICHEYPEIMFCLFACLYTIQCLQDDIRKFTYLCKSLIWSSLTMKVSSYLLSGSWYLLSGSWSDFLFTFCNLYRLRQFFKWFNSGVAYLFWKGWRSTEKNAVLVRGCTKSSALMKNLPFMYFFTFSSFRLLRKN